MNYHWVKSHLPRESHAKTSRAAKHVSSMEGIKVIFTEQTTNRIRDRLATCDGKWEVIKSEEEYKKRNFQESFVIKISEQQENETNRSIRGPIQGQMLD